MTNSQYTSRYAICKFCHLPIREARGEESYPGMWVSNFDPPNDKDSWKAARKPLMGKGVDDDYKNFIDEPWWTECPGTSEEKKQFASFGEWWTTVSQDAREKDRGVHEPMDPLSALVVEATNDNPM